MKWSSIYHEDLDAETDFVEWSAPSSSSGIAPEIHMDACYIAKEAFSKKKYHDKKLRTEEVRLQCNATIMNDNPSHELLQDPMFESMMAVMEESERR